METIEKKTPKAKKTTEVVAVQQSAIPVVNTPDKLLVLAIDKGMGIAELEKLMDLQERWFARLAREQFQQSLSEFQNECPEIAKTKAGYDNRYFYAPLGQIDKAIKGLLYKFGLNKKWEIVDFVDENKIPKIKVTCIVSHVAGHSESTSMEADHDASGSKNAIQARGSSISYMQRYTLIGALGITTADIDVDAGNNKDAPPAGKSKTKIEPPTDKQWTGIKTKFQNKEVTLETIKASFTISPELEKELNELPKVLPLVDDDKFKSVMKEIISGKTSLQELESKFSLSETQHNALKVIEDSKTKKK